MPIYEYKCENGHVFEVMQHMSDESLTECEVCGAPVQRVFHPIAVHFKGSGFYNTDYGTKRRAREKAAAESAKSSNSSSGSDSPGSSSSESSKSSSDSSSSTTTATKPSKRGSAATAKS